MVDLQYYTLRTDPEDTRDLQEIVRERLANSNMVLQFLSPELAKGFLDSGLPERYAIIPFVDKGAGYWDISFDQVEHYDVA